jgi:flagellar motor switch protein FliM
MAEVLSQDEIDKMLNAIAAGNTEIDEFVPSPDTHKIRIYDFKWPDKFSRQQLRTVFIIHEIFAREIINNLSKRLKAMFYAHVASVDQLAYEEFIRSIPTPAAVVSPKGKP